jgi:hypothetical protein
LEDGLEDIKNKIALAWTGRNQQLFSKESGVRLGCPELRFDRTLDQFIAGLFKATMCGKQIP